MTRRSRLARLLVAVIVLALTGSLDPASGAGASIETYYAPEDRPGDHVVKLYDGARRYIYVAVYGLTFPPVVRALVAAKRRGVDVRILTDRQKLDDPKQRSALETLALAGIPIHVNVHDGLMHLKQVVVDDVVNTSGSLNQTTSGHAYNDERLDIIHDAESTAKARDKFLTMWADHARYRAWHAGR